MKKIITILLILPLILFCGFFKKENKPYIILSSGTINSEYTKRIERNFNVGQRINYALIAPDGFKKSGVRLQADYRWRYACNPESTRLEGLLR